MNVILIILKKKIEAVLKADRGYMFTGVVYL